ncbi:hypothetical protein CEXT_605311 [Caerostris extrusa]|uniref:Uncharacterized protein n=1 Tax=Caerostris extrusa TaxID=172846 RepID=A0AAV4TY70_CAEEX|nr:hypothetical protein CEXT_605311 [Caerostris extrusa]
MVLQRRPNLDQGRGCSGCGLTTCLDLQGIQCHAVSREWVRFLAQKCSIKEGQVRSSGRPGMFDRLFFHVGSGPTR